MRLLCYHLGTGQRLPLSKLSLFLPDLSAAVSTEDGFPF